MRKGFLYTNFVSKEKHLDKMIDLAMALSPNTESLLFLLTETLATALYRASPDDVDENIVNFTESLRFCMNKLTTGKRSNV